MRRDSGRGVPRAPSDSIHPLVTISLSPCDVHPDKHFRQHAPLTLTCAAVSRVLVINRGNKLRAPMAAMQLALMRAAGNKKVGDTKRLSRWQDLLKKMQAEGFPAEPVY